MIKEAVYIKSITHLIDEPEGMPQVLFLGRSNVGKSSFINALTHRKNLARVSNTPGKTIALNFYLINDSFYMVDAPGYGYARRSKTQKSAFLDMLEHYLTKSRHLMFVCLLIDFKVGPTDADLETYQFLKSLNKEIVVIATKKDKIPRTHQFKQEKLIKNQLGHPEFFYAISSVTKENMDVLRSDLLQKITGGFL
ncbi:MAG: YihA family ribosome biogenesis GTP-binding protein [Acholeplasmataceae bacterium]|nr:YihA family ribosome biogenesis GTP-binding protein [Acholeplasmataceae bacterium]